MCKKRHTPTQSRYLRNMYVSKTIVHSYRLNNFLTSQVANFFQPNINIPMHNHLCKVQADILQKSYFPWYSISLWERNPYCRTSFSCVHYIFLTCSSNKLIPVPSICCLNFGKNSSAYTWVYMVAGFHAKQLLQENQTRKQCTNYVTHCS